MVKPIYCDGSIELTKLVTQELQRRESDILSADRNADKTLTCDEYVLWHGGNKKYKANFKKLHTIAVGTRKRALRTIGWNTDGKSGNKVFSDDGDRLSGKIDEAMKGTDQPVQSQSVSPFNTKEIDRAGKTIHSVGKIDTRPQVEVKPGTKPQREIRTIEINPRSLQQNRVANKLYQAIGRLTRGADAYLATYDESHRFRNDDYIDLFRKNLSNDFIEPLRVLMAKTTDLHSSGQLKEDQYKYLIRIISDKIEGLERRQRQL